MYPNYNFIRPQLPQPPGQMMPLGQPMMQQMGQPNGQFPLNPGGQQPTALPLGGQPLMGQGQQQHPPMLGQNMMQQPMGGGQQHSADGIWSRIMGMLGGSGMLGHLNPMVGNALNMAMNRRRGY
jgi:hypothetical protein